MSAFPQSWMTIEEHPRRMTAVGRSGIDPDVLVAYFDGDVKRADPQWILDDGNPAKEVCSVVGEGVKAVRLPSPQPHSP